MKATQQEFQLYRFNKYLWLIRRGTTTVAYLSVGTNKRYYVLRKDPRVPIVENCSTAKKAFEAFRQAAGPK